MNRKIVIKQNQNYCKIFLKEILYCKADGQYCYIFLKNKNKLIVSKLLKNIEELIDDDNFYRISRYCLINLNYCTEVLNNGSKKVVLITGDKISVSRLKYKGLIQKFYKI